MKKITAVVIALLLITVMAGTALATAGIVTGPPVLSLTLWRDSPAGNVLTGLTASRTPALPAFMIEPLSRQALTEDALLIDAASGLPLPAEAPVGTGTVVRWSEAEQSEAQTAQFVVRGDVLGTGRLDIAQVVRLAAHLNGSAPLAGVYLEAADCTGSGTPDIADLVWAVTVLADVPTIGSEAADAIVQAATDWQTSGGSYQADIYHVTQLRAGDRILGMLPGQSAFYTNADTLEAAQDSYVQMYSLLQMVPHPEFGYRTQVGIYEVQADIWVATGYCLANSVVDGQWTGPGGGVQYVLPDYESALVLVDTIDLHA